MSPGVRVLLGLFLVLPACSLPEEPVARVPASGPAKCIEVERALESSIEDGLKGNRTLGQAVAAEASDLGPLGSGQRTWFVAAQVENEGTGLWITNVTPEGTGGGLIIGINAVARTFSTWGADWPEDKLPGSEGHPRAQKAIECAEGR